MAENAPMIPIQSNTVLTFVRFLHCEFTLSGKVMPIVLVLKLFIKNKILVNGMLGNGFT